MQRYLPAQLLVTRSELARCVERHDAAPDFLGRWLRGDAVAACLSLT